MVPIHNSITELVQYFLPTKGTITAYDKQKLFEISDIKNSTDFRLACEQKDKRSISMLDRLSKKAGYKNPPKLIIYKHNKENAASLTNGTILLSTEANEKLEDIELEAVIGHELTHNLHRKASLSAHLLSALGSLLSATFLTQKFVNFCKIDKKEKSLVYVAFIGTTFPILNHLTNKFFDIPMNALSRHLEKDADRGAVILTGKIDGSISSLKKLQEKYGNEEYQKKSDNLLVELKRTHPRFEERISHLEKVQKEIEEKGIKNLSPTRFF